VAADVNHIVMLVAARSLAGNLGDSEVGGRGRVALCVGMDDGSGKDDGANAHNREMVCTRMRRRDGPHT
jgi:hypothetical protein